MTDGELQQVKQILELPAWAIIEEMIQEPIEDMTEGRFEDIAIHTLAKKKARVHIAEVLNRLKRLSIGQTPKESFK